MLMRIGWSQKVTNEELYAKVKPKRNLLQLREHRGNYNCLDVFTKWMTVETSYMFDIVNGNNTIWRPHAEKVGWWRSKLVQSLPTRTDWCHDDDRPQAYDLWTAESIYLYSLCVVIWCEWLHWRIKTITTTTTTTTTTDDDDDAYYYYYWLYSIQILFRVTSSCLAGKFLPPQRRWCFCPGLVSWFVR